jgi:uncharacterized protein
VQDAPFDAGRFGSWLDGMERALRNEQDASVPCNGCTACCTGSQFVHIAPDEHDTLAHIPPDLLFPAPRRPAGHVLLGYDALGCCPMLVDGVCSIYTHRPRTCRTYDCRIFAATGLPVDDEATPVIADRASRWRFRMESRDDETRRDAVRAAATYLVAHASELPHGSVPPYPPQLAVLAVELAWLFLGAGADGAPEVVTPALDRVSAALGARRERALGESPGRRGDSLRIGFR